LKFFNRHYLAVLNSDSEGLICLRLLRFRDLSFWIKNPILLAVCLCGGKAYQFALWIVYENAGCASGSSKRS
jgi:hypothetical protein